MTYDYNDRAWIGDFQAKLRRRDFLYRLKWRLIRSACWIGALVFCLEVWRKIIRAIF